MTNWKIYEPDQPPAAQKVQLPPAPPWRQPGKGREHVLAETFRPDPVLVDAVNTALYLRRPLLITGKPGTGKSALIHSVARQLQLGPVIEWAINSRSTLQEGLYQYDALARLQHIQQLKADGAARADEAAELGTFLTLGPLGTALASPLAPRALLVDEIDKSDVDLPNDLLNVLDTGHFVIPELRRAAERHPVVTISSRDDERILVRRGEVTFTEFPFVVMTSNGERDFPAPFLRRCVQCQIPEPGEAELQRIVQAHFGDMPGNADIAAVIADFVRMRGTVALATDQLLNAVHMVLSAEGGLGDEMRQRLRQTVLQGLGG